MEATAKTPPEPTLTAHPGPTENPPAPSTAPELATEPTNQGNQFILPGCEKDKRRGPKQMDLF